MSIIYADVKYPKIVKHKFNKEQKYVHVTTDPSHIKHLPSAAQNCKFPACYLPEKFKSIADRIHNFTVRADDVWIVSYPKSGSTWLETMAWLLKHNLDYKGKDNDFRCYYFEMAMVYNGNESIKQKMICSFVDSNFDAMEKHQSPRVIKTHLPINLLPKQLWTVRPKILYIARNPKDVVISFFHYRRNVGRYLGTFTDFLELFLNDCTEYDPYHNHVLNFWHLRNMDNVLFMMYEDMIADLFAVTKRINQFLECDYTDNQLMELSSNLSFEKMKANSLINNERALKIVEDISGKKRPDPEFRFLRKGKAGGFRDEMSADMIKRFDDWTAEKLKGSDFKFAE